MKRLKLTAVMIVLTLVWVGFAANAMAFAEMPRMDGGMDMNSAPEMTMAVMDMKDCPEHVGKMTMVMSKCVTACYGLVVSVGVEPLALVKVQLHFVDAALHTIDQLGDGRVAHVPTPPPNFA